MFLWGLVNKKQLKLIDTFDQCISSAGSFGCHFCFALMLCFAKIYLRMRFDIDNADCFVY